MTKKKETRPKKKSSVRAKRKSVSKNKLKQVEKLTKQLLELLLVDTKLVVKEDDEGVIHLQLDSEDPGALIGYHGETLFSLQFILTLMLYRQTNEWTRLLVNVGDYRERRQESLEKMAMSAAQRVKFSGESQALPPMPSVERRLIHLALANDPDVMTESEGEDGQRRVVVRPK